MGGLLGHGETTGIDFGTEAGMIGSRLAIPAVVCGPGSMAQGHKPDEYLPVSELDRCHAFLSALVRQLAR